MKSGKSKACKYRSKSKPIVNNSASCSIGYRINEDGSQGKIETVGISFDGKRWTYMDVKQ